MERQDQQRKNLVEVNGLAGLAITIFVFIGSLGGFVYLVEKVLN